ncbi:transcriptional regulator [Microbispora rosea subsp. aerata]|nr:LuxR family transcriptional regulator [Microbispora rosea]GGO06452.1 transcriptional regulator [Microbispora rosea subsp. aerata]GIH55120.1 transcriptional regulator [Microbispora rosea subsp. aerata]GLJ82569.1 transcriptional regulator [Microbispora rosea subsp. aerata]
MRGRDRESDALRGLVDGARAGAGGCLLLLGGPGTGKTALLDLAAAHAAAEAPGEPGLLVLRTQGVRGETHLPYAGLHALLDPIADRLNEPDADARVLADALRTGAGAGGLTLPAALLRLLRAAGRPVLLCADDVQWLDAPSREAIFFVARRARAAPLAVLAAAAEPGAAPADLPPLPLAPLDERASRQVLDDLVPDGLPGDLRAALVRAARGNPLALAELAGSLTDEHRTGAAPPPETPPRGGRLWRAYADRLRDLPADTADLVLLVAADPGIDAVTLVRAAESRSGLTALEAAEAAGVVVETPDGGYDLADPILRHVAYAEASLARRRAAHRLLASLLDGGHQRLRRAWHRAAALDDPPGHLAEDLVRALAAAPKATAFPEPFRVLERAAELTEQGEAKAVRLVAAARHAWQAGQPQRARSLLSRIDTLAVGAEVRGRADLVRGSLELRAGKTDSACDTLLAAAERLLRTDREQAVRALVRAGEASYLAGDNRRFLAVARRAEALRRPDDDHVTRMALEYLTGMAATFRGRHREATVSLRRVAAGVMGPPSAASPSVLVWGGVANLLLGNGADALTLTSRAVELARAHGAVASMPQMLEILIQAQQWMGRYDAVTANAMDGLRLAQETGRATSGAQHLAWLAFTAAVEGDEETCALRAQRAVELAAAHGVSVAEALGTLALAHLDVAAGRHADAVTRLRTVARTGDPLVVRVMATPLLVESAVRTGDITQARDALVMLDRWAASTRDPDRLALAARCHALLAPPAEAGERFAEALELHRQGSCAFETARTRLLYGGMLRRSRRPRLAREHLHGALETFERYGARLWSEHARAELRAAGESVRPADSRPEPGRLLTAQQLQIATLVAEGATNREVAARLFISPRTVEHHLRNIFARLGVRSRVELTRLLS